MMRGMRRFSVAGPASNSGSTAGSRKSHTLLSLPTWAEEEDEAGSENSPRVFGNPMLMRVGCVAAAGDQNRSQTAPPQQTKQASHSGELNGNGSSGGGVQNQRRSQHGSISNGSTHSVGGGGAQAAFAKRIIPEATFSFLDMASSCSSSGAGSIQHNPSARGNQHRLRTPYSISIPSMIGSPLSFTQSFLASRTSMYGRQPPSSQIRAAHIDWDSLSAMEEAGAWGGGGGGSSNRDLPLWQQGLPASIDPATGKGTHPTLSKDAAAPSHGQAEGLGDAFAQGAAAANLTAAHFGGITQGSGGMTPPDAVGDMHISTAHMALLDEWEKQMAWDYACHQHPLLMSFGVASGLRLDVFWRWLLLAIVGIAVVCVLIGSPTTSGRLVDLQIFSSLF
ncbi:hypothetical protein GGF40_003226 [Coemansia sp. RSA 1286]|nr:hypothetical protein GGF40_003226 [Coemansia sp. RSA 1286]